MAYFVGIDVSQRQVSICVLDQEGKRLWRGKCLTDPAAITATLEEKVPDGTMTLGLETGPLSPWLVHSLRQAGHTVVCLDARAVHAALSTRINKNDQNDAEGLAQILRIGWYRSVHVKSYGAHRVRAMLGARAQLVGMVVRLSNQVRGILKVFGIVVGGVARRQLRQPGRGACRRPGRRSPRSSSRCSRRGGCCGRRWPAWIPSCDLRPGPEPTAAC